MEANIQHKAIAAAAGAGKTYQLVTRYIALLAAGVPAERIIALTFSRKAAGEMFDRVVAALARAAASESAASDLGTRLCESGMSLPRHAVDRHSVCDLLRHLLQRMHLARISTLDSFFVNVVQSFPFELGLGGETEILDGYPAVRAKQEVLRNVLLTVDVRDAKEARAFLEDFKQATFGQESKRFMETVDQFVTDCHTIYLEASDRELWGNPAHIWPTGCEWLARGTRDTVGPAIDALLCAVQTAGLSDKQMDRWQTFLEGAREFNPVADWNAIRYLFGKIIDTYPSIEAGSAGIKTDGKTWELGPALCAHLVSVMRFIMFRFLDMHLNRTRGVYSVLDTYERHYRRNVRQRGQLTFSDVTFLLACDRMGDGGSGFLGGTMDAERRLYVDFRLDGHFDHWLLDEFQDTSTLQWQVLKNLVDEVLQDASGTRSLFYVGDVKQAIYGWRGGDPQLFEWIPEVYNPSRGSPRIIRQPLAKSYRSSQPVIDTVNTVFDGIRSRGDGVDSRVWDRWEKSWTLHDTARSDLPGFAALYTVSRTKRGESPSAEEKRMQVVVQLLHEAGVLENELSVAALVRTNAQGKNLVDYLRRHGIEVAFEGSFQLLDNPVTSGFASLFKVIEHPADTFAWAHVQMTPLRALVPSSDKPPSGWILSMMHDVYEYGFEYVAEQLARGILPSLDAFGEKRLRELIVAAREFDATGNRRCPQFVEFLRSYEVADAGVTRALQVMTIHKAKGLEFDMVMLPAVDRGTGLGAGSPSGLFVKKSDSIDRTPEWVLDMPRKDVVRADARLTEVADEARVDAAYEEMCNLYVALTRARHAVYVICDEPSPASRTVYPSTLLMAALGNPSPAPAGFPDVEAACAYVNGDPAWIAKVESTPAVRKPTSRPTFADGFSRLRFERRTPSGDEDTGRNAALLFSLKSADIADIGSAVHGVMSKIEWWHPGIDVTDLCRAAREEGLLPDEVADDARAEVMHTLKAPAVRQALTKPKEGDAEVWRERRFEVILNNRWVSGCFDRVTLVMDPNGSPVSATILDYKTSTVKCSEDRDRVIREYTPQLCLYRDALVQATGLPSAAISLRLVLTKTGEVLDLDF